MDDFFQVKTALRNTSVSALSLPFFLYRSISIHYPTHTLSHCLINALVANTLRTLDNTDQFKQLVKGLKYELNSCICSPHESSCIDSYPRYTWNVIPKKEYAKFHINWEERKEEKERFDCLNLEKAKWKM